MRVGVSFLFNNAGDRITDQELYRENLRVVDLIEPLGFDSAWAVEHHFTNYTICPDTIQLPGHDSVPHLGCRTDGSDPARNAGGRAALA